MKHWRKEPAAAFQHTFNGFRSDYSPASLLRPGRSAIFSMQGIADLPKAQDACCELAVMIFNVISDEKTE